MRNAKTSTFAVATMGWMLLAGISAAQAESTGPASRPVRTKTIIDFRTDAVLKKIAVGPGVSIARTSDNALEVRVAPFAEHNNQWPLIAFSRDFFGEPLNLSGYSRLEVVLHHLSEGMARVDFDIATPPDTSTNVDYDQFMIPGQTTMTAKLSMTTLVNNDPSEIGIIQFIFRPRPTAAVYRLEPIRAVYDPSIGSPSETLLAGMAAAKDQFNALKRELASKLPADQQQAAQQRVADLGKCLVSLTQDIEKARSRQFYKAYRSLSRRADEVVSEAGKLRFLSTGPLCVWVPDRYPSFLRDAGPDLQAEPLKEISVSMAGNEFRDFVFSVAGSGRDLSLNLAVRPTGIASLPAQAIEIRQTDYPRNTRGEYTGDVLVPVGGSARIPSGESRQFWVRFNTRTIKVPPRQYTFELAISDDANSIKQVVSGKLEVWNFSLPSYDILPNNSYSIFSKGVRDDASGEKFRQAMADMKLYGLNYVFVEPPEIPVPTGLDDQWKITGYDDTAFSTRLKGAMEAWRQAPGEETLNFIISLSGFEEMGLKKEGYAFLNAQWKQVLTQYIKHLKSLIVDAGLKDEQWMLVLRDESMEPALMQWDIPMAEAIKSIDPTIRMTTNSSAIVSDPAWAARYFKAFDVFQPHRWREPVYQWLRTSGKPIWLYECDGGMAGMGRDLYDYFRLYTWDMLDHGFVGAGVWMYYSTPHDRPWNEDFQGCQLVYLHPERGLVHSRRYEMFRESLDDYRYVAALRAAAGKRGGDAVKRAQSLIQDAVKDIMTNRQDRQRCETWRVRMAQQVVSLQQ